jgi:hypothetical protein
MFSSLSSNLYSSGIGISSKNAAEPLVPVITQQPKTAASLGILSFLDDYQNQYILWLFVEF